MTRYARIDAGVVAELLDTGVDMATLFPPALYWVPAGDEVLQGWGYADGVFSPPAVIPFDPQGEAMTELTARIDRLLGVISGMQADYIVAGDMTNASLCRDVKAQLTAVKANPVITGAASRADFNAAALTLWRAIAASAPADVRAEFARYATAA